MSGPDLDLERLMEGLARAGVTMLLKVDHERMADRTKPWTIVMSGPALGDDAFRADLPSLVECLDFGLHRLRALHGDWGWLDEFTF
jgi:hypothetical protein